MADKPNIEAPLEVSESAVPATWPGAFGLYQPSKRAVRNNLGTIIGLSFLYVIVGAFSSIDRQQSYFAYGSVASFLIGALISAALVIAVLASIRNQKIGFVEALSQAMPFWIKNIGLSLLVTLAYIFSTLLLIIPVLFVIPRLTLATYFLIDKNLGIVEAFKASWYATKGHALKSWGIIGVQVIFALLAITIIGIPFSIYFYIMYSAAFGLLYEMLRGK